jgi:hypothetical protein
MDDFKSYASNNQEKLPQNLSDMVKALAGKYDGATEEELIRAIVLEAEKGRRNGTLTDADIDRFVSMLAPILDDKKRKILYAIAEKLKKK